MNEFELAAKACFDLHFGYEPERILFAPGRVNLIGEHIDYNGGRVLPCSLSIGTYAAASRRDDGLIRLASADMGGEAVSVAFDELMALPHEPGAFGRFSWAAYPLGVAAKLASAGYAAGGFDMAVSGSLPRGSGLSSSASLEVLTCAVLAALYDLELDGVNASKLSLAAERDCAGVNCGIMDQFICAVGRADHALLLDTHSLEHSYFPFDPGEYTLLIMNTKKPRRLADSKYNERRAECEEALRIINSALGEARPCLCSIEPEEFERVFGLLPPVLLKRARHAVTENARTKLAAEFLSRGDMLRFGELLNASHDSLRYDYEVTGFELDTIVEAARRSEGVLGARMTGAGFGGCAIALAPSRLAESISEKIAAEYREAVGYDCEIYSAKTADAPFAEK